MVTTPCIFYDRSLTSAQVILWWGIAELKSPRWRPRFESALGEERYQQLQHATYETLSPQDIIALIQVLRARRRDLLATYVFPATQFYFAKLTPDQLDALPIIREMNRGEGITLRQFINQPPYSAEGQKNDPRVIARGMIERGETERVEGYPILGWDAALQDYVLVEGYARCLSRLLRSAKEDVEVIVCVP